jgi:hypothetical protein
MSHLRIVSGHTHTPAEGLLLRAIEIVQRCSRPDSGLNRDDALDQLFDVLDGPEARHVYQTLKAGRRHHRPAHPRHWHQSFAG